MLEDPEPGVCLCDGVVAFRGGVGSDDVDLLFLLDLFELFHAAPPARKL